MAEALAEQLRRALNDVAADRTTITYLALAERIRMPGPHRIHRLTLALEDLVVEDHENNKPLIAALAIGRGPDGIPGPGFFQLLSRLGRYEGPDRGPQAIAAHDHEKRTVWNFWGQAAPK
ncbi:MAG: hypothetical protein AAF495_19135 [Pseudomonadota bacterium]